MNRLNGKEDRFWKVEEVIPYIICELKKRFPDSIIDREFCKVDIMVLGPNIPVEIQKTPINIRGTPGISEFENLIRKQIEQNIDIYGQCWFFFDAKLLYHLQNNLGTNSCINMDWFYQFYKSEKLKIFVITIDGVIRELEDKDFEFIRKFSQTCRLSKNEEYRILVRNKSKITYKVLNGYGFNTEDIISWYNEYEKNTENLPFVDWLKIRGDRERKLSLIRDAVCSIIAINEMLKCNMKGGAGSATNPASILGIIRRNAKNSIICSDEYNILEYFPGYIEKKELWDYWRTHVVDNMTFIKTVKGEYDYLKDRKNQKNIEDAWK